ncbi:MAG: SDR family NAD(P)-dependent oxidoreductase [Catenulispora sp.]|nr:SDR family NAD(P)-dependent oxidoreductase [Catenulispora sp.]
MPDHTGSLSGTVALVTGASSGIGHATALALASAGASVAVLARRADRLDELAARIVAGGGEAAAFPADVADAAAVAAAVEGVVERFGRLDIVVNNAGVMPVGLFAGEGAGGDWDRALDVNLRGMLAVTQAAIPHLVRAAAQEPRRVADIVNISSTAGRVARPGSAVYSLTKFGIGAFTESLRQELQPSRVRVAVVEPGMTDTELANSLRGSLLTAIQAQSEGVEPLDPADVGDAVVYVVTRSRRVAVNELLVRAAAQTW